MKELVSLLTSQLNINEQQATGGVGALLKLAQEKLGGDFSTITKAIPGIESAISSAPTAGVSGLGGVVGSVLSTFGMGDSKLAGLAQVAGQFKSLHLDADMIGQFAPIIIQFIQQKGGPAAAELIQKVLSGK